MKREARVLLDKAVDSLVFSYEVFNRPVDRGRQCAVLLFLHHSFEMLIKAALVQKGRRVCETRDSHALGFKACLNIAQSDAAVQFLDEGQVRFLRSLNNLRGAEQHYHGGVSESLLYIHGQAGLTLFRDVLRDVFGQDLTRYLPGRVLPISTMVLRDLAALFADECDEIQRLLKPGRRRTVEAMARLRSLVAVDAALRGDEEPPTFTDVLATQKQVAAGLPLDEVFPGVATMEFSSDGVGMLLNVRLSKRDGHLVQIVPEGTSGALPIVLKRVNELDYYSLGHKDLARTLGLSPPKLTAVVWRLKIKDDVDCFKAIQIGGMTVGRHSSVALDRIKRALPELDLDEVWSDYKRSRRAGVTQ